MEEKEGGGKGGCKVREWKDNSARPGRQQQQVRTNESNRGAKFSVNKTRNNSQETGASHRNGA